MTAVPSRQELVRRLSATTDVTQYRLHFAALLASASKLPDPDFIVVGGSAIEVYTVGAYTSGDIDIACRHADALSRALETWGFTRQGRAWVSEELRLYVDPVRWPYTGSTEHTRVMTTPFGPVRLAAIEDLVVKRLSSAKHWGQPGDLEHARLLCARYFDILDWDYLMRFAREHQVAEMAQEMREALQHGRGTKS